MITRTPLSIAFGATLLAKSTQAQTVYTFLVNGRALPPILQLTKPRAGASCAARKVRLSVLYTNQLHAQICEGGRCTMTDPNSLVYRDRVGRVDSVNIRAAQGDPVGGLPEPVTDTDGLMYLCREEEQSKECICTHGRSRNQSRNAIAKTALYSAAVLPRLLADWPRARPSCFCPLLRRAAFAPA
ncbi:MAG: hypothetical protein FJW31_06420 [Acidobacteria bacterium]|nr:hypothetical protein [Acidobacteriota bacterium]